MAGRFWKRCARARRAGRPHAQGITGRPLIAALAVGAVALVTSGEMVQAQTGGAPGQSSQPPPFVEPVAKVRAQPPAETSAPEKPPAEKRPSQPPAAAQPQPAQPQPAPPPVPAQPPTVQPAPAQQPQPPPGQNQPYAPYPYAPQYPYGAYPYAPGSGYPPPQYAAPAYPPPPAYPPQSSWPPAAYPPPPAGYPPAPSAAYPAQAYPPPPSAGGDQVPTLTGYAAPPPPPQRPSVVDPQGDRVILLPTATTHPQGTFYFSNYEVIVFQAGYAFTDSTQLSVTAIPVPSESVTALDFSLKSSVYRGGLVRAAAIGSASGVVGKDVGVAFLGRAGAVVQVCLAQRCESSLSLSTNAVLIGTLLMVNGAGGIWRISPHVSLLGELATMLPLGSQGGPVCGALLSGGVRLHYTHWGFDFTALHVLDSSDAAATVPFFAMTYRP
jgi:hypothetical protein